MTPRRPRSSWFAFWKWKWWAWCAVALTVVVTYVLSPPITVYFSLSGVKSFNEAYATQNRVVTQKPLYLLVARSPELCALYQMETDLIEAWLGRTQYRMFWGHGRLYFVYDGEVRGDL